MATSFNARYTPQERGRDWNDEWFMGDILRVTRWGDKFGFEILLPGYIDGVSEWSYRLDVFADDDVSNATDAANATKLLKDTTIASYPQLTPEGLIIKMKKYLEITHANSARLIISYTPNPGLSIDPIEQAFYIDD